MNDRVNILTDKPDPHSWRRDFAVVRAGEAPRSAPKADRGMSPPVATCEQCGNEFQPRKHGGEPQRFCSTECRRLFQKDKRCPQLRATAQQPPQPRTLPTLLPALIEPPKPENAPQATPEPSEDFDWNKDDSSIILREQPATAVYFNKEGSLVIRQHRWPDDDIFIYIAESSIGDFLDKLTDICGVPSFSGSS
jgi:hypothetical protein